MNNPGSSATRAEISAARSKAAATSGLPKPRVGIRQTPSVFCRAISYSSLREASEEVDTHPQMTLGLDMSRALHRALAARPFNPLLESLPRLFRVQMSAVSQ